MGLFHTQTRLAVFSPDRRYRYRLTTVWDMTQPFLVGFFCNPSIADERRQDNTDRIFRARAAALGYGGAVMINMFAFVSTDPTGLDDVRDPVGPENDTHILEVCAMCKDVFCGWGNTGNKGGRADYIRALLRRWKRANRFFYLAMTKQGQPGHPLYLRKTSVLVPWEI